MSLGCTTPRVATPVAVVQPGVKLLPAHLQICTVYAPIGCNRQRPPGMSAHLDVPAATNLLDKVCNGRNRRNGLSLGGNSHSTKLQIERFINNHSRTHSMDAPADGAG